MISSTGMRRPRQIIFGSIPEALDALDVQGRQRYHRHADQDPEECHNS